MAYFVPDRYQNNMLPSVIDDYVGKEDPARVYNAFVDALDFTKLGIPEQPIKSGQTEYSPRCMVKLLVYGYAYGIQSARKLEQAGHHNLSFIWLMGNLKPDYRTIARFRQKHSTALKEILKQCVSLCIKWKLIEGNHLFIDSSCFRASASMQKTWDKKRCEETIKKLHEHIDTLVNDSSALDQDGSDKESLIKLRQKLTDVEKIKQELQELSASKDEHARKSINTTDEDAVKVHGRQGTHAGYKAQITIDGNNGLIVSSEAVSNSQDAHQLSRQVKLSEETLGSSPQVICSDSGYYDIEDISKIDSAISVIIPHQNQTAAERGRKLKQFGKEQFCYDKLNDEYVCPAGKRLKRKTAYGKFIRYHACAVECRACIHFGECTSSCNGRDIYRFKDEKLIERLAAAYSSNKGQAVYKHRKEYCEHPFGHIKRNLGFGQFLMRGLKGVNAELSLVSTAFNLRRMMSVLGVAGMLIRLNC